MSLQFNRKLQILCAWANKLFAYAKKTLLYCAKKTICLCKYFKQSCADNMIAPYLQTISCNQASIVMVQARVDAFYLCCLPKDNDVICNQEPRYAATATMKLSLRLKSQNFCEVRFAIWHDYNRVTATKMLCSLLNHPEAKTLHLVESSDIVQKLEAIQGILGQQIRSKGPVS